MNDPDDSKVLNLRSIAPWNWGIPVKLFIIACVLLGIVLAIRETKKLELKLPQPKTELQRRMDRNISNLVGEPSPFEDVDKEDLNAMAERIAAVPQWQGQLSPIAMPQNVVIKTLEDWQALWPGHIAPDVDFENFMVAGVFLGTKPNTGYSVQIMDIKTFPDKLQITYREINPTPGALYAQVLTQPYALRGVPKTNLPVIFQKKN
jgi:hypothetical protein